MIYLLVYFLLFVNSGCKMISKAPISELRVVHITEFKDIDGVRYYTGVCSIRDITDKNTLSSVRREVADLSACNGVWGLTAEEFAKTRVYLGGK